MNFLNKVIKSGLIFDGAMGTMLIKAGYIKHILMLVQTSLQQILLVEVE